MLDEEMDDMIRQAIIQHHPAYNNKAWDKMEQLLEKHLPQKKDRRGFIFYLFFFLLAGSGLFIAGYYFTGNKKKSITIAEPKRALDMATVATTDPANYLPKIQNKSSVFIDDSSTNSISSPGTLQATTFTSGQRIAKTRINIVPALAALDENGIAAVLSVHNKHKQDSGGSNNQKTTVTSINPDKNLFQPDAKKEFMENGHDIQPALKKSASEVSSTVVNNGNTTVTAGSKIMALTQKKQSKRSIAANFGLSFSAGPDISYVEMNKPGKITFSYGVGLSYTFIKKLNLQTGFYVSRKIYSADSADYHAPGRFWTIYPNMNNTIDATCKVYEVPVNLVYNFRERGSHNWFAGAGISTYFMKHETYDYSYTYAGSVYAKSYSINNENQHNFSVITVIGGYQYKLSPRISLSAEPYVKLPLNGIGFGKVRLKGAGVLFNVTMKPFAKKNAQKETRNRK